MNAITSNSVTKVTTVTKQEIYNALPRRINLVVDDELENHINQLLTDAELRDSYKDNLLSYTVVLQEGKFSIKNYVKAVQYVTYKLLNKTNEEAFALTFPDRYKRLVSNNATGQTIAAHVASYHKCKLVGLILAQTLTPAWVYNQAAVQEAINTQVKIMRDENASAMAKVQAANSVLTHLQQPETAKIELDVRATEDQSLAELKKTMNEFAKIQKEAIQEKKAKVIDIAESEIVRKDEDKNTV